MPFFLHRSRRAPKSRGNKRPQRPSRKLYLENLEPKLLLATEVFTTFPNVAIPDFVAPNPGVVTSTINVTTSAIGAVQDVNVLLRLNHTWQGDLSITLSDGTSTAVLVDRLGVRAGDSSGYPADHFGAGVPSRFPLFTYLKINDGGNSDASNTGIHLYNGTGGGIDNLVGDFQPDRDTGFGFFTGAAGNQPLANLDGPGGNRTWTLTVRDHAEDAHGTLLSWGIELTGTPSGTAEVVDNVLYVAGTENGDSIKIKPADQGLEASVIINGASQKFAVASFSHMEVLGNGGDDEIRLDKKLDKNALVLAGPGNDTVQGGGGNNVVVGGPGDDTLKGGPIDDVLIGGDGIDKLSGGKGKVPPGDSDLLVGESTAHDGNLTALLAILAEWAGDHDYPTRIGNLLAGAGGLPKLDGTTLTDDADPDTLIGGKDDDWFVARANDTIKDRAAGEQVHFGGTIHEAAAQQAATDLEQRGGLPAEAVLFLPPLRKRK